MAGERASEQEQGEGKRDYIILFGAAVSTDGRPSHTLASRIEGAAEWAAAHPRDMLIATGGVGRRGPAEAWVMAELLRAKGIADERILLEPHGRDTLESVRLCDALLRERGDCARIVCCTSAFHQPRCALLFRLLGYRVVLPPMPSGRRRLGRARYARYVLKEAVATPYDALLMLGRRAIGRR
ncbi:MAG TPA: YdcF family protein [Allosphingosinicella sp.]|jgi:uncharacterized SAM-binding protein YcdF (DUF218 family)|nr:YdcF family protein [Allosphingosinicella sp.]